jgi:2-oxoglutarate ferredoxin oxidoreductase subunit beta
VADRARAEEARVLLRHGQPLRFGKGGRYGLVVRDMEPAVVDLEAEPARAAEVIVHNARSTSPALAALLAELEPPQFPTALGIFRQVERPTYDDLLLGQIRDAVAKRGRPNLQALLQSGTTWVVE